MVITIDGPAGVGKSTLAKCLAERLGWLHLNSGLFYRYAGYIFNGNYDDLIKDLDKYFNNKKFNIYDDLAEKAFLTSQEVGEKASLVSSYPPLRDLVNNTIRQIAQQHNLVAEGRDMSTVTFPEAILKIYLDAEINERAKRRWLENPQKDTLENIKKALEERDRRDREKEVGALKQAQNSWYIDSTHLTIVKVCEKVLIKLNNMMDKGKNDDVG